MRINLILISILALLCTGCYEEYNINLKDKGEPRMCMSADVNNGVPVVAYIGLSHLWGEDYNEKIKSDEVEVKLYADGRYVEDLVEEVDRRNDSESNKVYKYISTYIPHQGEKICIVTTHPKYGEVRGETQVPVAVKISNLECILTSCRRIPKREIPEWVEYNDSNAYFDFQLEVNVEFDDPADEVNFYNLSCSWDFVWGIESSISVEDPIFNEYLSPMLIAYINEVVRRGLEGGRDMKMFSDYSINGKRKKFKMIWRHSMYVLPLYEVRAPKTFVELQSLSEYTFKGKLSLFNYLYSYKRDLAELGLGEYIWVASNVSTSGGYISSVSSDRCYVDIDSIVRKQLQ